MKLFRLILASSRGLVPMLLPLWDWMVSATLSRYLYNRAVDGRVSSYLLWDPEWLLSQFGNHLLGRCGRSMTVCFWLPVVKGQELLQFLQRCSRLFFFPSSWHRACELCFVQPGFNPDLIYTILNPGSTWLMSRIFITQAQPGFARFTRQKSNLG